MKFDHYEVLCREDGSIYRLGQGATSSSYKAMDTQLRVPVVLKVIRPELLEDENSRKRFLREARAAALLRQPNVAQIYRMGEEGGVCFYAREFVEGETLESKINREGPLEAATALNVALQVAEALVAVKEAHLVHRDIKPSNLMLTPRGEVKIIDFGLTKSTPNGQIDGVGPITQYGFVGSSDYASPEQLNEEMLDVASDIYSLGVTLWFLLTARCPFRGPQACVMSAHLHDAPPFEELSAFSPAMVSLLAHMLEKKPANRPATPTELVAEIKQAIKALKQPNGTATTNYPLAALPPNSLAVPIAKKISPAREPALARSPRQFVLAELMVGAAIAVIIYLVLSRPVDSPASAMAAPPQATVAPFNPPPLAAQAVVKPAEPLMAVSNETKAPAQIEDARPQPAALTFNRPASSIPQKTGRVKKSVSSSRSKAARRESSAR
jgi:serine/threonine protein kinase